jgi:hypothetical protein
MPPRSKEASVQRVKSPRIVTNHRYIEELDRSIDIENPKSVLVWILNALPDDVTVFPSENYYYYLFVANGMQIGGNIAFPPPLRDKAALRITYDERVSGGEEAQQGREWSAQLDASTGVLLKRVSRDAYEVTADGRTVTFRLASLEWPPTASPKLRAGEVLVAPCRDESGIRFHLVYNNRERYFLWLLDEANSPKEPFSIGRSGIYIGHRTGFIYCFDARLSRKVLLAVNQADADRNTWFDGPFDQIPDNLIQRGQVDFYKWLVDAQPDLKGRIDKYGYFQDDPATRVAVSAYAEYGAPNMLLKRVEGDSNETTVKKALSIVQSESDAALAVVR